MRSAAYLILIALWYGMPFQATAQLTSPVSLEQLQSLASQQAVDVLIAQRDNRVSQLEVSRLQAELKPQVRLDATIPSYFSSFRETIQPDGTVRFQPVNINNSSVGLSATQAVAQTGGAFQLSTSLQRFDDLEQDFNIYNGSVIRLGYSQPLWGYNSLKWRKKLVPMLADENDARLKAARLQAAADATVLFFNLAAAELAYTTADSNAFASDRLLTIANERFVLGKISKGDLVQLELELAAAQQNRLRASRQRLAATTLILDLIGQPYEGESLSTVTPVLPQGEPIDEALALSAAQSNRPEAIANARRLLQAESSLEQNKRENGFQANLSASVGLIRSDPKLTEVYRDPQIEQVAELRLSVPLMDWGRRKTIVKQAEAELDLARTIGQREQQSLSTQVRLAVQQYNQAQQELDLLLTVRDLAVERYRITRESYLLGAVPLTQLTFAQQARDQRLRDYLSGLENAWTAHAQLNALTLYNF
ncbi:MAG: TolC family protein [Saprospiraceae bacterium]